MRAGRCRHSCARRVRCWNPIDVSLRVGACESGLRPVLLLRCAALPLAQAVHSSACCWSRLLLRDAYRLTIPIQQRLTLSEVMRRKWL